MNDRRAEFLAMVGDVCRSARLAQIPVTVKVADGTSVSGVPRPHEADGPDAEVDHTGWSDDLQVNGHVVSLESVVEIQVGSP
jgi:hypothetical protein